MRTFKHLTKTDRIQIESWRKVNISPRVMADTLGVHISTIYRELKRGQYEHLNTDYTTEIRYSPDIAEQSYQENLRAKGAPLKIGNDHVYAEYIEYKISVEKYSPGAVLGEIRRKGIEFRTSISKTTLYRYIDQGVFLTITNKNLPVKKNKDAKKYNTVKTVKRPPRGTSIEKRPTEINSRITFGNWEMDCVEGKKGTKKTLLVLTERYSRNEIIRIMKDKTSESVVKALDGIERQYGSEMFAKVFQTITVDNGSEFSDCCGIERSRRGKGQRTKVYYCHPYSAYERGSNENANKLVRRHYPKGVSFEKMTTKDAKKLELWINTYPRGIFDYMSADDIFQSCINSIA